MTRNIYSSKLILLITSFALFATCKNKNELKVKSTLRSDCLIEINIDTLVKEKSILFSSVFKDFKIIPLETKDESLIGEINQLEMSDDTLYILDSNIAKALFLFDNKGKYVRKVGKVGKGYGEYLKPSSFSIDFDKKQIKILDAHQKKVIVFSTQGQLIHEIKLIKTNLIPIQIAIQDDYIYIDQLIKKNYNDDYLMYAINNSGEIKSKWFSNKLYSKGLEQPFNSSLNFFKTRDDIKYVKPLFDTIFSVKENTIKPFLVVSTKNRITSDDILAMNRLKDIRQMVNYYYATCNKFMGITNYIESDNLISFEFINDKKNYKLFYWPKSKEVFCTNRMIDDLTHQKAILEFCSASKNHFIYCLQNIIPETIEKYIENIKDKKINLTEEERLELEKLTPNSNPVIIFYECRDKFQFGLDLSEK